MTTITALSGFTAPMSLAKLKRHLKMGTRIRLVYRAHEGGDVDESREVSTVEAKGVYLTADKPEDELAWMPWQSANSYKFTDNGFEVWAVDRPCGLESFLIVRYEYIHE